MAYYRSSKSASSSTPAKNQLILAIGRRAFVHLPSSSAQQGDFTPCGRKPGAAPDKELVDGQEVEIIAWNPMGPDGVAYQIHRLSDHCEWWARATCLRITASASRDVQ